MTLTRSVGAAAMAALVILATHANAAAADASKLQELDARIAAANQMATAAQKKATTICDNAGYASGVDADNANALLNRCFDAMRASTDAIGLVGYLHEQRSHLTGQPLASEYACLLKPGVAPHPDAKGHYTCQDPPTPSELADAKIPTVILDGWWDIDYAKNSFCARPAGTGCSRDPATGVRDLERQVIAEFAEHSECYGMRFLQFDGPDGTSREPEPTLTTNSWTLMLDYDPDVNDSRQSWTVVGPHRVFRGTGSPQSIVRRICTVVLGRGAKISP